MPTYKLTYFSLMGRGEPIRMILNYGKIPFEDYRIDREDWPKYKSSMPFGQVPVLEIDGKVVHQTNAICRYLGKQVGLAGSNDLENLEIDMAVDTIEDVLNKLAAYYRENHPEAKEQKYKPTMEAVEFLIKRLDDQVKKNNGYLANNKLSWGDIYFIAILDLLNYVAKKDVIENAENLKALKTRVLGIPQIKAWVAKRPKSDL